MKTKRAMILVSTDAESLRLGANELLENLNEALEAYQLFDEVDIATITDAERLRADLDEIRRRGWSLDDEERSRGMRCIAAPIFDENGEAIAGLSISGPADRLEPERVDRLGPMVRRAADAVTRAIGGRLPGR